ncbi:hypothetical protein GIB67_028561 [Kingdonia uniflora]|uniref:Uncharacterized protein n=1 Tax=Kingdonia uniflora TaxID=39325 RepID=A0A7J7NVC1_9MAGN|nr:hypothetical protein GIB67_028561 [Kingdonia uniflora]
MDSVLEILDSELNGTQGLERHNRTLLTSYTYLPSQLKPCFLYCGMFPGDHIIKVNRLIHFWVAEGFIEEHPRKTLEEVTKNYLSQLMERNMFQAYGYQDRVGLRKFKLHNLMRDIAIHMLRKEEFSMTFPNQRNCIYAKEVGRLAIHDTSFSFRSSTIDLSETNAKNLPTEICDLIHLRYLSLRRTKVSTLPALLHRLQGLQTFDFRDTKVKSLPPGTALSTFPQMRRVYAIAGLRIGWSCKSLSNLQTLCGLYCDKNLTSQLHLSTRLTKLYVCGLDKENCIEICAAIKKMQYLRSLTIKRSANVDKTLDLESMSPPPPHLEILDVQMRMSKSHLPQCISSLKYLHTIHLLGSDLRIDPFSTLAQLPKLEITLTG